MSDAKQRMKLGAGWWAAAVAAAAVGLGAAWWMARPDRSADPFTRLAGEIGCQCGTCPLRPIATCGCGFADSMLAELRELVDQGLGDEEIMTTFVSRYNESVRISPDRTGWGLAAWAVPLVLLSVGGVLLAAVVVRWAGTERSATATVAAQRAERGAPAATGGPSGQEERAALRARLEKELEQLEP